MRVIDTCTEVLAHLVKSQADSELIARFESSLGIIRSWDDRIEFDQSPDPKRSKPGCSLHAVLLNSGP